jgi:hypothetical protein
MSRIPIIIAAGLLFAILAGCGATLTTQRLPTTQLDKVNGLAVNHNVPYELIAIFPTEAGSTEVTYERAIALLPSADEIYVINFSGQLFTSRSLEVELHPDTTVKRVKIDSKATIDEGLNNLTEAATQVGELRKALQKKEPPPALDAENEKLQREILNLMLRTNVEAIRRGEQPPYKIQ